MSYRGDGRSTNSSGDSRGRRGYDFNTNHGHNRGRGGYISGGRGRGEFGVRGRGGYNTGGDFSGHSRFRGGSPSSLPTLGCLSKETWELVADGNVLTQEMHKLQISKHLDSSSHAIMTPLKRPGLGTVGLKCVVKANHFLIQLTQREFHHYNVFIKPETSSKSLRRDILSKLVKDYEAYFVTRFPAYDGEKSLYSAGPLPFTTKTFAVNIERQQNGQTEVQRFQVDIKFASKVNTSHLQEYLRGQISDPSHDAIQVLDVVLRAAKPYKDYVTVGRSFFSLQLGKGNLGEGLEFWRGYYQSIRPTQMGLSLNIDGSAQPFYKPVMVHEFLQDYLNLRDLSRPLCVANRVKIERALKGITIEMNHMGCRRRKVIGVSNEPVNQQLLFSHGNTMVSVSQYFREKYKIQLRHPSLLGIQIGHPKKPVYLPMELCKIKEGQTYLKKLNERQVTALLRATCQRPHEREGSIKEMVVNNRFSQSELINHEFGMSISEVCTTIGARVLPPPMYHDDGKEKIVAPVVGQWKMIDKKMYSGATVNRWTLVSFSSLEQGPVQRFCRDLVAACVSKGINIVPDPCIPVCFAHPAHIKNVLKEVWTQAKSQLELLIIVLPDSSGFYGTIKKTCETELGIVSQCCQPKHVMKYYKQYLDNVALKINVKVGGRNTVLIDAIERNIPLLTDHPTIIFGADVTHASPGEDSTSSIASVVASMDWPEVTKYKGLFSVQGYREEIIQNLYKTVEDPAKGKVHGGMIRDLLISFYSKTGHKPHRIIFFRDGVCEGQFSQVLFHEMDAIRKACASLEDGYAPPVTFVVVQKRHHTRLFPVDSNLKDKSGNILPGTVVDTEICHPSQFDFYLCSHAGIQGTSRPVHYHVLYDENNFSADLLQLLTNSLCYTFARCTRSVCVVPPVYYAHLLAFRARYYMEGMPMYNGSAVGKELAKDAEAHVPTLPKVKENVKEFMFYC